MLQLSASAPIIPDKISGVVYDADTFTPLPYANLGIKGSSLGTVSNAQGHFYLNLSKAKKGDYLMCSYMGYETAKVLVDTLKTSIRIALKKKTIMMSSVVVNAEQLDAKEIITKVLENKLVNYDTLPAKHEVFSRHLTKTTPLKFRLKFKNSTLPFFTKDMFNKVEEKFPSKILDYSDWVEEIYVSNKKFKTIKIKGVSHSNNAFDYLENVFNDVEKILEGNDPKGHYWKVRSGVFAFDLTDPEEEDKKKDAKGTKADNEKSQTTERKVTPVYYYSSVFSPVDKYLWRAEFMTKTSRYTYKMLSSKMVEGEMCYVLAFEPKGRGAKGKIYISMNSYAVLRLHFSTPADQRPKGVKLLGIEYKSLAYNGIMIFNRRAGKYNLKYIRIEEKQRIGIDRVFAFKQKKKRRFIDKTTEEVKFRLDLRLIEESTTEALITSSESISIKDFDAIKQIPYIKPTEVENYDDMSVWEGYSILQPTEEMKAYRNMTK